MNLYLLAILLLSNSVDPINTLDTRYFQSALSHNSVIQKASNSAQRKVIGGVGYNGFRSPTVADDYLRKNGIKLIGSPYSSKLARTAQKALLRWLKENGNSKAKVEVSIGPMPIQTDNEITLNFTATGLTEQ
jgi:hypothetical protein